MSDPARKREYDAAREGEGCATGQEASPEAKSKKRMHREDEGGEYEVQATLKTKSKKRKHCEENMGELEIQKAGKRPKVDGLKEEERQAQDSEGAPLRRLM